MATILARLRVHPGKASTFEDTIRPLYADTHALEPACRRYEYWRGSEPDVYYCLLSFDDFLGFMTHQTSDHHEAPDFPALLAEIQLEWVDPIAGASELAPTNPQALPPEASELLQTYANAHAFTVPEWWVPLRDRSG